MSKVKSYTKLLEPLQIRHVKFRNRIIKPAQRMGYAGKDGAVTERALAFYKSIAAGGVGALIVEHAYVDFPLGVRGVQFSAADDKFIPGLKSLADVIHRQGCPAIQQINHAGPQLEPSFSLPALAPSMLDENYLQKTLGHTYRLQPLSILQIDEIVEKFAAAGERVRKAGFDGLEIHAAHTYLLASFLSRIWNKRNDEYGCITFENRTRFAVAVLKAVRERVGPEFIVGIRINGTEHGPEEGMTPVESRQIALILEKAGADYISVLSDDYRPFGSSLLTSQQERILTGTDNNGFSSSSSEPDAAEIKRVVSVPVIAVGTLDPTRGEAILRNGAADLIGMGRRLFADPQLPNKLAQGIGGEIIPCLHCGTCVDCNIRGVPVFCRVNPSLGKELDSWVSPTLQQKRVAVVGGGPAGMEAARVAALRGHRVTIYEKEQRLGGLLPVAAALKGFEIENLSALVEYYQGQLTKLGVEIKTAKTFSPEMIGLVKANAVIVATGGMFDSLTTPRLKTRKVIPAEKLHRLLKFSIRLFGPEITNRLSRLWLPIGKNAIIIGGSIHGCEVAEFLIKRRRKVTILEMSDQAGTGIPEVNRRILIGHLLKNSTIIHTGVTLTKITREGIAITTKEHGELSLVADTILITLPLKSGLKFTQKLKRKDIEIHFIGDAKEPGLIGDAISDGFQIGRSI